VAIGADNFAAGYFLGDTSPTRTFRNEVSDGGPLIGDVVEVQDDDVGFAAVDTRVSTKVINGLLARYCTPPALRLLDLVSVQLPALAKVLTEAVPAPPLVIRPASVEVRDGQIPSTSSALALLAHVGGGGGGRR
jgi:hypothetical protein